MYTGTGCVKDNVVHVETLVDVKKVNKNVNMVNHCIFCIRKISANQEAITSANFSNYSARANQLKEVPCAPPEYSTSAAAPLCFALKKIWSHLQKGGHWDWDEDQGYPEPSSIQFTCFPKICHYCAANFSSICDLMFQLKAEINKLGVIIRESKKGGAYSWRAELFEQTLKESAVDRQCISDTLEFLGIPQENQSRSVPASSDSRTLGVTKETDIPSVITETLLNGQPTEEETSQGHFDFHDEGSEDDTNNDPNYVKEEEDAFLDSKGIDSATQDFDNDPLDDDSDSKPELDQSLTSAPELVEMSTLDTSTSHVKTPIQNVTNSAKKAITTRNKLTSTINRGVKIWNCSKTIKIHQQKDHSSTDQEVSGQEEQKPKDVCNTCGKTFRNKFNLRNHIKNVHINAKVATLKCDLCKIGVPKKDYYEHVRAHVGEEYLIRCPNPNSGQCSFVCCTPRGLLNHLRCRVTCRTATPDVNDKYLKPRDAFICQVCGDDLGSLISVRLHLNEWHEKEGRKEFPCPIEACSQRFNFRQSVLLHIPLHVNKLNSSSSQPCDVCKEKVKFEEMEQHLKDTHHLVQETIIKCFQCPFLFSDRTNLVEHLYVHRHIALFCDICSNPDTTFYKLNDLRRHYFTVHQIGSKFLCEHCESEYFSARGLEEHLAKRHPVAAAPKKQKKSRKEPSLGCSSSADISSDVLIVEKKFKCDECDKAYKSKRHLKLHKTTIHKGKLLPCKFCKQTFNNIARKYSHEEKHRHGPVGPKKERFLCQVAGCEKEFSAKKNLKNHIACAHGQNPNVCDQCGKAYAGKSGLVHHIQSVHMGVRNQVCDVCGESFSHGTVLKRHKLIHTGDRPFACQLCGQKFRHKGVLKKHVETHERKGADFKPNGPMKQLRKRVDLQSKTKKN